MGKKLILFFIAVFGGTLAFAGSANAATFLGQDAPTIGQDQVVDGSLYIAGNTVTVAGTVKGDLFCGGQSVEISGMVEGDVICSGQTVNVTGTVTGDVRVAAQMFSLGASVDKSVTVFGQTVNFNQGSFIGFDATVFAETLNANGQISRDLVANAGTLNISGVVSRLVQANVNNLNIANDSIVGDVDYTSSREAEVADGATVASLERTVVTPTEVEPSNPVLMLISGMAYWFVAMLLIGAAILIVKPGILPSASDSIKANPGAAIGWGALFLFATPIISLLLAITIVGIPLAFLILLAWFIVLIVSQPIAAYFVGNWIMAKTNVKWGEIWTRMASLALGLLIIVVLTAIPFVGWLFALTATALGAGSLKYSKMQSKKVKGNV
ncbi:MAG TPA: polymer-forming cytoskeletal protein [Candidatus Saccharimonadales bacterium]|nr:polymer-forming cytoskeletal protein [Candidatus Saccharimonadales bacterium]